MNDDSTYCYDTANSKTSCVAHEYLCRISIIPKEANQGTYEGHKEYYQLFRTWYIHDVQVGGVLYMATYVAKIPNTTPMIAEFPAHIPSIPSLRLAPLETAVTTKMVIRTNSIQPPAVL